jgi:protein arginine kinase activator
MNCDNCNDDHVVHIKLKIDGEEHWIHWDEAEAKANGFHSIFDNELFPLPDIIASALEKDLPAKYDSENNPRCPDCGLSFLELLDIGRIGCARCYTAFADQMDILLDKIHGASRHVACGPRKTSPEAEKTETRLSKKDNLKLELKKAIETENYERAARLRDKLKKLETVS